MNIGNKFKKKIKKSSFDWPYYWFHFPLHHLPCLSTKKFFLQNENNLPIFFFFFFAGSRDKL